MSKWGFLLAIGAMALGGAFVAGMKIGSNSPSNNTTIMTSSANAAQPAKPAPILPPESRIASTPAAVSTPAAAETTASLGNRDLIKKFYGEAFRNGPHTAKHVALTFDDGPSAAFNARFLALLQKEKVPATFFMIGRNVTSSPEIVKSTADAGFEIGAHTMNHPNPARMTDDQMQREMLDECELIQGITGKRPRFYRPPYGMVTRAEREIARDNGLVLVTWSIDTKDWESRSSAESIHAVIMRDLHPGAIILMHEIKAHTIDALPRIIADIRAKGYEIVPVSQLIEEAAVAPPEAMGAGAIAEPTPIPPQAIPMSEIKDMVNSQNRTVKHAR